MPPEFWIDSDSLIQPSKEAYSFTLVPQYWDFLQQKARQGIVGSPEIVLQELEGSDPTKQDDLEVWAKQLKGVMFLPPDQKTQAAYADVANWVQNNNRFAQQHIAPFLTKADGWLVAYAKACGGQIVTFEKPAPLAKKPKIPDVADHFDVKCITLWTMLKELNFKA